MWEQEERKKHSVAGVRLFFFFVLGGGGICGEEGIAHRFVLLLLLLLPLLGTKLLFTSYIDTIIGFPFLSPFSFLRLCRGLLHEMDGKGKGFDGRGVNGWADWVKWVGGRLSNNILLAYNRLVRYWRGHGRLRSTTER